MTTSGKKASLWRKIQEGESRVAEKKKIGADLEVRRQRSEAFGKLVELKRFWEEEMLKMAPKSREVLHRRL